MIIDFNANLFFGNQKIIASTSLEPQNNPNEVVEDMMAVDPLTLDDRDIRYDCSC